MKSKHLLYHLFRIAFGATIAFFIFSFVIASFVTAPTMAQADQLTGNWAVRNPNADGTVRSTYFNLKQEGPKITGSIRVTQFYYLIIESTGDANGFTLTGSM